MQQKKKIRRWYRPLVSALIAVGILTAFCSPAYAEIGDNIGGGSGGGSGSVTDSRYKYFNSNPQGYRVTLISKDGQTESGPIDIVNSGNDENYAKQVKAHFDKTNKLAYLEGSPQLETDTPYTYSVLASDVPKLPDFFDFNIEAIKRWFTTKRNIEWLCESDKLDFDVSTLIDSPEYKLLVEPLVYIQIPVDNEDKTGSIYAMTATEGTLSAMGDKQVAYNLAAIVRRQLPISMFLEFDDNAIGVKAYKGSTNIGSGYINNNTAFNELGLGIIYFTDMPVDPNKPDEKPDPPLPGAGYKYDLVAHNVTTSGLYQEENHFGVQGSFDYQQEIECYACDKHCSKCGDDGLMPLTTFTKEQTWRECASCDGSGMNSAGTRECGSCKGFGYVICGSCKGTGTRPNGDTCMVTSCDGGYKLFWVINNIHYK